uniref:PDZ domain-containing protein n=1 Tax=Oreochromis aureus TaxID=47969 RepID=A0A668U3B4_OREAU
TNRPIHPSPTPNIPQSLYIYFQTPLFPGQPAEQSGRIQEGDVLLAINGQSLKDLSYPVCADAKLNVLYSCTNANELGLYAVYTMIKVSQISACIFICCQISSCRRC